MSKSLWEGLLTPRQLSTASGTPSPSSSESQGSPRPIKTGTAWGAGLYSVGQLSEAVSTPSPSGSESQASPTPSPSESVCVGL